MTGKKKVSTCTMCSEVDNDRMVQCDSCDRWCHYDCARVGDEINNMSWNCESCNEAQLNTSSQAFLTPQSVSSPTGKGATPMQQLSAITTEVQQVEDAPANMIVSAQSPMVASMEHASSRTVSFGISPQTAANSVHHYYTGNPPLYTLAKTTNIPHIEQTSTRSAATYSSTFYNNNNPTLLNKQATPCTQTSTNLNVGYNSNFNAATMFQQHLPPSMYTANQQQNKMQDFCFDNQQQNRMRHDDNENKQIDNVLEHQRKTLELEMIEEEQRLKQYYLRKKYELLQQFGENQNKYHAEVTHNNSAVFCPSTQQLSARHVLPKELPAFNGDPEEWPIFISSFNNSTAVGGYSNAENLIRLQQCLKGKAREIVRNKLLLPSMVPEIMQTLQMYFGRPELILERIIDKARQMPPPKDRLDAIIDFAMCVRNICSTIEACNMTEHLTNPMLVKELLEKLSNNYKLQWAMLQKPIGQPSLKVFSDWLYSIAEAASQVTTLAYSKKGGFINTHTEVERPAGPKCYMCDSPEHKISECSSFTELSIEKRWQVVSEKKMCKRCLRIHRRKCYVNMDCGLDGCKAKHHPLLHTKSNIGVGENSNVSEKPLHVNPHYDDKSTTLFRIIPVRVQANNKIIDTFAFLDEGSSITLIEEELFNSLNMTGKKEPLCLKWTSDTTRVEESSYRTSFNISNPNSNSSFNMTGVRTVKNLALPQQSIDVDALKIKYPYLTTVPMQSYCNARPTILIGTDNWNLAVPLRVREGPWNQPIATKTRLGWALQGVSTQNKQSHQVNIHVCDCNQNLGDIHEAVKQMFTLESSANKNIYSAEDEKALGILESTCTYTEGRFEVGLPWRNAGVKLPDSYETAYNRSVCLQKKIKKDSDLKSKIEKEINNLLNKGYARKLTQDEIEIDAQHTWYLPIFVTSNPNKPSKVRLVWDAAARSNGTSLNDFLLSGPDLLTSLIDILLAFRIGRIAICGDIAEMFHQILVRNEDINVQRFLWWNENDDEAPSVYVMNALTFGLNCAPCIAHFVRNKNGDRFEKQYPRAVEAIKKHHYVDDLIESVDTEDEAIRLADQIRKIHSAGGFQIRNWASNSTTVLNKLCGDENAVQSSKELGTTEKILGVHWDPVKDVFKYIYKFPRLQRNILDEEIVPTKREILKALMSIYDPLGFLSCYTIGLKILLQEIWRSGINWDNELSDDLDAKWKQWKKNMPRITSMEVPRCYSPEIRSSDSVQLHTFVDAGELGYAAICYLRIKCGENVSVVVVMAKNKVTPLKPVSIPRLELQAAVLGIRLALKVTQIERIPISSCHWWSDSKTVLKWLRMDPRKFQQFVMHRVAEILEHSEVQQWNWVPSKDNPADLATKVTTNINTTLWLNGPKFLLGEKDDWPLCDDLGSNDNTEVRPHFLQLHKQVPFVAINVTYFSDWRRLYRAMATFFLYLEKLKATSKKMTSPREATFEMICKAKVTLYGHAQSEAFNEEISCLKQDDDGLLRVRGRTENLSDHKDVIVLPKDHHITHLVVKYAHEGHHHVSHETVVNNLKSQYYIPKLRVVYRKVRNSCQRCKNEAASPKNPQMAPLPPARLGAFERPFTYTGIDYFGPIAVTVGRRCEKRWGVIFTCLTTRAIHLEVAHSLDTSSCIMCLRNFIGRRGYPKEIYTDNGTNFKATERVLREELHKLDPTILPSTFDDIKWFFNPPAAPHMGGAWERLVRSVKTVLYSAYPKPNFNDETFRSALIEVEFIVNSRPLTFVSLESCDDEAITPNHLLLGSSTGYKPVCSENLNLRQRWNHTQAFADHFWRRWVKEYAPIITRRGKWFDKQSPIAVGDVVLIVDEHQPRNVWLKGIVIEAIVAKDGQVRRATVRTKNGVLQRPANKLAVLDVGNGPKSTLGEMSPAYGGGNVADGSVVLPP